MPRPVAKKTPFAHMQNFAAHPGEKLSKREKAVEMSKDWTSAYHLEEAVEKLTKQLGAPVVIGPTLPRPGPKEGRGEAEKDKGEQEVGLGQAGAAGVAGAVEMGQVLTVKRKSQPSRSGLRKHWVVVRLWEQASELPSPDRVKAAGGNQSERFS
jgi:hypothetical protein